MQAIIFALISYFTWGTGAFFEAIVARKLDSYSLTFWGFIFSALILSFYAFFQTTALAFLTLNLLILNIILGVVLILGIVFITKRIKAQTAPLLGQLHNHSLLL
jgi:uncharacterized membrane protein